MAGLVAMPLIAELAMRGHGWRAGWVAIGVTVLAVGFVPVWLLMVRRPEDLGLLPDNAAAPGMTIRGNLPHRHIEATFSRRQAVRTPAFWLLLGYTVLVYPVQAGVSLHQAANLIEHGHRADDRGVDRQPVLADVGRRQRRLRVDAALIADPLSDGAERRVPDHRLRGDDRRSPRHCRVRSPPRSSGSASAAC